VQVVEFMRLWMIGRLVLKPERVGKPDKKGGNKYEEEMAQINPLPFLDPLEI